MVENYNEFERHPKHAMCLPILHSAAAGQRESMVQVKAECHHQQTPSLLSQCLLSTVEVMIDVELATDTYLAEQTHLWRYDYRRPNLVHKMIVHTHNIGMASSWAHGSWPAVHTDV